MTYGWMLGAAERGNLATKAHVIEVANVGPQSDPLAIRRKIWAVIVPIRSHNEEECVFFKNLCKTTKTEERNLDSLENGARHPGSRFERVERIVVSFIDLLARRTDGHFVLNTITLKFVTGTEFNPAQILVRDAGERGNPATKAGDGKVVNIGLQSDRIILLKTCAVGFTVTQPRRGRVYIKNLRKTRRGTLTHSKAKHLTPGADLKE